MSGDHVERVEAFLDAREANGEAQHGTISVAHGDGSRTGERPGMYRRPLTDADLRALVAEVEQLRAAVDAILLIAGVLEGLSCRNGAENAARVADLMAKAIMLHAKGAAPQQPEDDVQTYTADANQPEIRDRSAWCWNRHPDHPLPCGRLAGYGGQHARGERRWGDEQQPEDGDRG